MARIGNFRQEIAAFVNENLSPAARQKMMARKAQEVIDKTAASNEAALGRKVPYDHFVDGREGAPLESINPNGGVIAVRFHLVGDVLKWIGEQLETHSPVRSGRYKKSHILLADGVEVDPDGDLAPAEEFLFVSPLPYARKIERGLSKQAPDGVYDVVADMARRRYGNMAMIKFTYRSVLLPYVGLGGKKGGKTASRAKRAANSMERETRYPAIQVNPR
jgi:hypothetical protein